MSIIRSRDRRLYNKDLAPTDKKKLKKKIWSQTADFSYKNNKNFFKKWKINLSSWIAKTNNESNSKG